MLASRWRGILSFFADIPEGYRRVRNLPPPVRRAEVGWNEASARWEIAPIGYLRNGPSLVLRERAVALPGDSEPSAVAAALLSAFEQSVYLPAMTAPPGLKGWSAFVRDHRLVGASLRDGEMELAPWVRVRQGRGGSYTGTRHNPIRVSASAPASEIAQALDHALQLARELETGW